MPLMEIRLRINPETNKKDIIISLHSDEDALPLEHEQQHRALVDKLIQGGAIKAEEIGKIEIERLEGAKEPATPVGNTPEQEREAIGQGR